MALKFTIFKYPFLNGIFLPFKIYIDAIVTIRKNAKINLAGRLYIGPPDSYLAKVSAVPANIYFGNNCNINFGKSISVGPGVNIIVKDNASLSIGDDTYFTSDMHLEAVNDIKIGKRCAISWGVTIIDDDHHEINYEGKKREQHSNVIIGDHVWIACNVTVLKGTVIGNNCIVAAGSVVKGVFGDNVLIAGNPGKVVRESVNWK
jgi:acetyltransferase-like isoleucine patch superfamily enzyme